MWIKYNHTDLRLCVCVFKKKKEKKKQSEQNDFMSVVLHEAWNDLLKRPFVPLMSKCGFISNRPAGVSVHWTATSRMARNFIQAVKCPLKYYTKALSATLIFKISVEIKTFFQPAISDRHAWKAPKPLTTKT